MHKPDSISNAYKVTILEYFKNGSANIDYILANENEHFPEPERNNYTINERIHVTFHSLPFQAILHLSSRECKEVDQLPMAFLHIIVQEKL